MRPTSALIRRLQHQLASLLPPLSILTQSRSVYQIHLLTSLQSLLYIEGVRRYSRVHLRRKALVMGQSREIGRRLLRLPGLQTTSEHPQCSTHPPLWLR